MAEVSAAGAAMVAAGWSGRKLLGPLFDEIAEAWRDRYSERRRRNLARIGRNAEAKFDRRDAVADSWASPRVVSSVIDGGSWCEGPVMAEYFGGVLAASVSPDGADDRGVTWASVIAQLSGHDVFLHYVAYESVRRLYLGRDDLDLGHTVDQDKAVVYLPLDELVDKMELGGGDVDKAYQRAASAMLSLDRSGLLGSTTAIAPGSWLSENLGVAVPGHGLVFTPSTAGIELFCWAHGHGEAAWQDITDPELPFEPVEEIPTIDGAIALDQRPPDDVPPPPQPTA